MSAAARDRAFKAEMRAEGNLHPALQAPDGHYKARVGATSLSSTAAITPLSWLGSIAAEHATQLSMFTTITAACPH